MVSHSPVFPSEITFGSYVIYPSRPKTEAEQRAKTAMLHLKQNRFTPKGSLIELVVARLAQAVRNSCLAELLDGKAVLVPMPGSAPLLKNAVWCAQTVCAAMVDKGLGIETRPYVERFLQIRKSAYCAPQSRPTPREHYDTMRIADPLLGDPPERVVLVDDIVTKGATFMGSAALLRDVFPSVQISAFAVAHTEAGMTEWIDPCLGTVYCSQSGNWVQRVNSLPGPPDPPVDTLF